MSPLIEWLHSQAWGRWLHGHVWERRHGSPGPDADIEASQRDHERMSLDLRQIKRANEYLLDTGVHEGKIRPETAAAIRMTAPSTEEEERLRRELEIARLRAIAQVRTRGAP